MVHIRTHRELAQIFEFSKFTKAKRPTSRRERLRYWANNARKLANFMEKYNIKHQQDTYGEGNPKYPCQTAACALGTAAVYNLVPGLQYGFNRYDMSALADMIEAGEAEAAKHEILELEVVVNGKLSDWSTAGKYFFGEEIYLDVFTDASLSKEKVIRELRVWAKEYTRRANR